MSNLGTLVQGIADDLHSGVSADVIRRKACDAMRFHRDRRLFFSEKELHFTLTAGRREYRPGDGYGLPAELVEIASRTIWILIDGSEDQRTPCRRVDTVSWELGRVGWGSSRSQPEEWDFRTNALRLSPPAQTGTDVAEFLYLTNIGIPRYQYDATATAYKFYAPDGSEMSAGDLDQFTNDWLTQEGGEAAIRYRTMYTLQRGYLKDPDADATFLLWLESVAQLENETEVRTAGGLAELPACIL